MDPSALASGSGRSGITWAVPLALLVMGGLGAGCTCGGGATDRPGLPSTDGGDGTASAPGGQSRPSGATSVPAARPPVDYCAVSRAPERVGALADPALTEASGLVASPLHSGVYYVHNDSGDGARFFATDESGAALGSFELRGAKASDWEDIAIGPCPQGNCIYLADFGDNYEVRVDYALYRVVEPASIEPGVQPLSFERFPFEYPDGHHNAETLLVHPTTGEAVVVTKVSWGNSSAYRFPLPLTPDVEVTLEKVAELTPPRGTAILTGGDVHPAGDGVLLRSYTDLFFAAIPSQDRTIVSALLGPLCAVPVAIEAQGEAVAWSASGDGWVTVSEGAESPLYRTRCGAP